MSQDQVTDIPITVFSKSLEWNIVVIRSPQVNKFRVKKQQDSGDDKATAEIEEVVEATLNERYSEGWKVYGEIIIGSSNYARIIFCRETRVEKKQAPHASSAV